MDTIKQKQTGTIWYIVAGILGALLLHQIWNTARQTEAISYSEFEQLVAAKKISEVVVDSDTIEGTLKEPAADGKSKAVTVRVDPAFADKLAAEGIKVTGAPPTGFIGTILAWTIPAFLFPLGLPCPQVRGRARPRRPHVVSLGQKLPIRWSADRVYGVER